MEERSTRFPSARSFEGWVLLRPNFIGCWTKRTTRSHSISSCLCCNSWSVTLIWWYKRSPCNVGSFSVRQSPIRFGSSG
jgi:hypothetical protein